MTRRQHELLLYIKLFISVNGHSPSFKEMASGLGLKSKSGVHRLVQALLKDGKIKMQPARARNIEVINDA